jgi:hypothetical protein
MIWWCIEIKPRGVNFVIRAIAKLRARTNVALVAHARNFQNGLKHNINGTPKNGSGLLGRPSLNTNG